MKKLAFLFVFALAGSLFLASCSGGDDDNTPKPKPSINWKGGGTYTASNTDVQAGNSIDFGINATASSGEKITRVRVTLNVNGTGALILADSTVKTDNINIDWLGQNVGTLPGSKNVYTATATQSNGQSSSVSFIVTVTSAGKNIQTRLNISMGGQTNSTIGSFFDYTNQLVMLLGEANNAPGSVDFAYYSGSTNLQTLSAPDDSQLPQVFASVSNWSVKNNTRFRKTTLTAADFDNLNDGETSKPIEDEATTGAFLSLANKLSVGDVIVFITAGGQEFGLLKVTAINAGSAGTITFDLKFGA